MNRIYKQMVMDTIKTTESSTGKHHTEWLSSLHAYMEHLQNMDGVTRQLQLTVHDLYFQRDLQRVRTEIVLQKNVVNQLQNEIEQAYQRYLLSEDKQLITIGDLIERNRLRDKILKTEKTVFMLKYQVNKILSLAS